MAKKHPSVDAQRSALSWPADLVIAMLVGCTAVSPAPAGAQTVTVFNVPTADGSPHSITAGPDGNLWFSETNIKQIGRITTAGVTIAEFPFPIVSSTQSLSAITTGPDGNLWLTGIGKTGMINQANSAGQSLNGYPVNTFSVGGIAPGPDGNLWFMYSVSSQLKVGRITTLGAITEFAVPTTSFFSGSIAAGADGNLWFTEAGSNKIGRITTAGVITEFAIPKASFGAEDIVSGPDGNLWFTEPNDGQIGRITPAGVVTQFVVPTGYGQPRGITVGMDGNLWFTEPLVNKIGRISASGVVTEFSVATGDNRFMQGITSGPDGNLWLALSSTTESAIGRLVPLPSTSPLHAAVLPSSRSVQVGSFATAFATIINAGATAATGCGIAPVTSTPANFSFQTTDPATNMLTGTVNTRVSIPAGGLQAFVVAFKVNSSYVPSTNVLLGYYCDSLPAAASVVGVNTLQLTFADTPVADMIAVGTTPSGDGFARIGGANGTGVFAIATTNVGIAAQLTGHVRLSDSSLPLTVAVCETDPQTAVCRATPAATVIRTMNQNEIATFAAFLNANGTIAADPAKNRVVFEFLDENGIVRGSTSTAVTTQ
jgi:streptogramin lyase